MQSCERNCKGACLMGALIAGLLVSALTGCMQLGGYKKVKLGTWEFEATTGFEVSAGVQQYDHALDRRGINVEAKDNKTLERY